MRAVPATQSAALVGLGAGEQWRLILEPNMGTRVGEMRSRLSQATRVVERAVCVHEELPQSRLSLGRLIFSRDTR
jgi:hypothetical protein